jgi:hypothetical protein
MSASMLSILHVGVGVGAGLCRQGRRQLKENLKVRLRPTKVNVVRRLWIECELEKAIPALADEHQCLSEIQ